MVHIGGHQTFPLQRIQQRHILKTFTDELELASTEKFEIEYFSGHGKKE
jgi:hypothetical protein